MGKPSKEEIKLKKKEYDRIRREKMKSDPVLHAKLKEKERIKYLKKIEKGQVKPVAKMSARTLRNKRKQWKKNTRKYREKIGRKKEKDDLNAEELSEPSNNIQEVPAPSNIIVEVAEPSSSIRGTSQIVTGRQRILRKRSKTVRELNETKRQLSLQKSRAEKYKKRYLRLKNKSNDTEMTPRTNIKKMLRSERVSPAVRKRLIFGEALNLQLKNNFKTLNYSYKLKRDFYKKVSGQILKKYRRYNYQKETQFLCHQRLSRPSSAINKISNKQFCHGKVSKTIVNDVQEFFERDDVSRMCPGKKDYVSRNKTKKQKRVLTDTNKNLHKKFLSTVGYKISYATFCRLKPFWVLKPSIKDRETCKCMMHSNMEMLVSKLYEEKIITYKTPEEIAKAMCCDERNECECLLRKCITCKDSEVKFNSFQAEKEVNYKKWILEKIVYSSKDCKKTTSKPTKKEMQTTALDLVDELQKNINPFMIHLANIKHQYSVIADLKKNLQSDAILLHIDFSENYSCKYGEEIQSVHFGGAREQITLHTGVLYRKENNVLTTVPFATASKSLRHDASAIWAHLKAASQFILEEQRTLNTVHVLSDGPCTQYRNKKMFHLLRYHIQEIFPNIQSLTWNYSEAGHGKGAPDGVGGTLKRTADRVVAEGKDVNTFEILINILKEECKGIKLIPVNEELISIADRMLTEDLEPFLGTLKVHQVVYNASYKMLDFRSLSCFRCKFLKCTHFSLTSPTPSKKNVCIARKDQQKYKKSNERVSGSKNKSTEYDVGEWVMVNYDNTLYPGEILSIKDNCFTINVMVPTSNNRYKWPSTKDIHTYNYVDIECKLPLPTPCDRRGVQFRFDI